VEQTSSFPSDLLSVWCISQLPSVLRLQPWTCRQPVSWYVPLSAQDLSLFQVISSLVPPSPTDWLLGKWIGTFLVVFANSLALSKCPDQASSASFWVHYNITTYYLGTFACNKYALRLWTAKCYRSPIAIISDGTAWALRLRHACVIESQPIAFGHFGSWHHSESVRSHMLCKTLHLMRAHCQISACGTLSV